MKRLLTYIVLITMTIPAIAVEEMVTYEDKVVTIEKHWYTRSKHDYRFFVGAYGAGCCYANKLGYPPLSIGANIGYLFDYRIGFIAGVNMNMYTTPNRDGYYPFPFIDGRFGLAFKYISFGLQYTFNNTYGNDINGLGGFGIITIPLCDFLALNFIGHGTCVTGFNLGAGLSFIIP